MAQILLTVMGGWVRKFAEQTANGVDRPVFLGTRWGSGSVSKFSSRYPEAPTVSEAGVSRECHGARQFSRFPRSERVNECEASENV
jgi:hypothetical protein